MANYFLFQGVFSCSVHFFWKDANNASMHTTSRIESNSTVQITVTLVIGCSGQEVKCSVPTPWWHSNRWQDHIPHNPKCLEHMQSLKMSNIYKMSTCSCILSRKWNVCTSFCALAPLNRLEVYWITGISSNILNLLLCQSDVRRYLSQSDYVYAGKEWERASKSSRYPPVCSERSDEQSVRPSGWCKSHLRRQTAQGFRFDTVMSRFLHSFVFYWINKQLFWMCSWQVLSLTTHGRKVENHTWKSWSKE